LAHRFSAVFDDASIPIPIENPEYCGNLGAKLRPPRVEKTMELPLLESDSTYEVYNEIEDLLASGGTLRGNMVKIKNKLSLNGKRLLIFGTSSAYYSLPAFAHAFTDTLFIWENTFDYNIILEYKPDCVLWVVTERFLPTSANDLAGLSATRNRWLSKNSSDNSGTTLHE
jgi:hypothetical protein